MNNKKQIRQTFRNVCLKRDHYKCVTCGFISSKEKADKELDVHHITNRKSIVNGGYVPENGITLCKDNCHIKAEAFHATGIAIPGFSINDLYMLIKSSFNEAKQASEKLNI